MTTVSWDILIMSHAYPNLSLFIAGHIIAPSGVRKSSIKILWLNKCSGRISFWVPIFGFQHPNSRKPFQPDAGLFSIFSILDDVCSYFLQALLWQKTQILYEIKSQILSKTKINKVEPKHLLYLYNKITWKLSKYHWQGEYSY